MQNGFTGLMLAATKKDSTDIIAALVEAKADPNIKDRVLVVYSYYVVYPYIAIVGEW